MTLKDFIGKGDRFAANSGVKVVSAGQGSARAELLVTPEHLNAGGVCQGGAIFTLADTALACAANSCLNLTLSLDATIRFHRAAREGELLIADAVTLCAHSKIPSFDVKVTNEGGELIASFTSTCYTKPVPLTGIESFE